MQLQSSLPKFSTENGILLLDVVFLLSKRNKMWSWYEISTNPIRISLTPEPRGGEDTPLTPNTHDEPWVIHNIRSRGPAFLSSCRLAPWGHMFRNTGFMKQLSSHMSVGFSYLNRGERLSSFKEPFLQGTPSFYHTLLLSAAPKLWLVVDLLLSLVVERRLQVNLDG